MRPSTEEVPITERTLPKQLTAMAAVRPEAIYLSFEGDHYSYAQVDRLTSQLAYGLAASGVRPGDHVALLLSNRPEFVWLYFALAKLAAVAVPLNTAAKGEQLDYLLRQSQSQILVIEQQFTHNLAGLDIAPRLCVVLDRITGATPFSSAHTRTTVSEYNEILRLGETPTVLPEVRVMDTLFLLYTSGTTGPSKACIWTQGCPITYGLQRKRYLGYAADHVLYTCLPLFHGNALATCFSALMSGARVALSRRFSTSGFWNELRETGATHVNLLGAMVDFLWNAKPAAGDRSNGVQCMVTPVPPYEREFRERFNVSLTSAFGLSDFGLVSILEPGFPPEKAHSAGRLVDEIEAVILDDDDLPVPAGSPGELCLRPRHAWINPQGYFNMPAETLRATRNLWFHTGDRAKLDEDGYLYFVDRKKDSIRRRGENISAWEVEQILLNHPEISEAAVFPVRAEFQEDEVALAVIVKHGSSLTPELIVAYCSTRMAYFMVPRFIEVRDEFPRTANHKVQKQQLRQEFESRLAQIWDRELAGIVIHR